MKILLSIALIKGVSDKITRKGIVTILFNKLLSLKGWNLDQSNIEQFNKVQNIFYWILYYRIQYKKLKVSGKCAWNT